MSADCARSSAPRSLSASRVASERFARVVGSSPDARAPGGGGNGSPPIAARAIREPRRSDAPTLRSAACSHAEAARRATAGTASSGPDGDPRSGSSGVNSDPEDRQVDQAGAEAQHGAVEIEQPLVLADRRSEQL